MATAVASKPSAPHQKMKRPPPPIVQTNGVHSHQSSPSPSMSTKRPPSVSAFKQPPPAPMPNGVNGNVNGMASRLSNRRREPQKPGDVRANRTGKGTDGQKVPKTTPAPYVKTQPYILKKYRNKSPSLTIHLHPTHFRFDQQDGSFSYSSPMKFILEHLKSQTVPHDMIEELQAAGVRFYEGCLIVQVQDHRSTSSASTSSSSVPSTKTDANVPFSIHNYKQYITPSPYVPHPQIDEEPKTDSNAPVPLSTETADEKDKQSSRGPTVFTVVLFPTPLSIQEEVFIQANTPDLRHNRKQSVQVPRTPASATVPPTPMSAVPPTPSGNGPPVKKQKMMISGQEIHEFESRAITTTAAPLFLDPVDNIEDAHTVLDSLTDPRHKQSHPAPRTRKRTVAELAADEAIAAQEQAFMLIMDERHNVSGPTAKAGTTDGEAGTATFEPRFETWQAIKNIKAEHKEKAEREAESRAHREHTAAAQKARIEQQAREHREDAIRRGREAEQQQAQEIQRQNHLKEKQKRDAAAIHRMQENQRESHRQALATSQNQLNHGHPMPHVVSQAQHSSPVVRNMTPNMNSSPSTGNIPMNLASSGQGTANSPARPPSAVQHGHPGPGGVAMGPQRSRQPPSRTTTPLMNGTPAMPHATPVVGHATPRINQGSPPVPANPVMNGMPAQGMNGHQQYTPQQLHELMLRQQHRRQAEINAQYQQRMQNGSPNPHMSSDGRPAMTNLHQLAQQNAQQNQHQVRNEYMASLQRQQQAQMQNGNTGHGMPNGNSPAQYQQARPVQQNPNQQPQTQQQISQLQSCIQMFYQAHVKTLIQRHNGNEAAITQQETTQAKAMAVTKGKQYFAQQQTQSQLQRQQQQIANMQAMGQIAPGMNGQVNGMGAHIGGQQMSEQQRQAMIQMAQMGGPGVPNANGGMHAHMNGGGLGGMQ